MSVKLNLSQPVLGLDGKQIGDSTLDKVLANDLVSSGDGPAIKLLDWAITLFAGKELDLDSTDLKLLEQKVENSQRLNVLVKGQILKAIEAARLADRTKAAP